MVFYVYIHPNVFKDAAESAPYGMQILIGILRGFLQNCCVAEFEDERTYGEIKGIVEDLPADFDRRTVKKLMVHLKKQNRFIYCLEPDYLGEKSDLQCVSEQADRELIQLLLVSEGEEIEHGEGDFELARLNTYNGGDFEEERSKVASGGLAPRDGDLHDNEFMDQHLLRALKHAGSIQMCDRIAGTKFGDNYEYTIHALIKWLGSHLADSSVCHLGFHFGQADGHKSSYIQGELANYKSESLPPSTELKVGYYSDLPHQRFIITDQFALEIDRGLDFLNRRTGKNRNVSINLKNRREIIALLSDYSDQIIQTDSI